MLYHSWVSGKQNELGSLRESWGFVLICLFSIGYLQVFSFLKNRTEAKVRNCILFLIKMSISILLGEFVLHRIDNKNRLLLSSDTCMPVMQLSFLFLHLSTWVEHPCCDWSSSAGLSWIKLPGTGRRSVCEQSLHKSPIGSARPGLIAASGRQLAHT